MKNILHFPDLAQIEEQACKFLARMDAGPLSEEETRALQQWLAEDSRHGEALLEVAHLMDSMTVLSALAPIFPIEPHFEKRGIYNRAIRKAGQLAAVCAVAASLFLTTVLLPDLYSPPGAGESASGVVPSSFAYTSDVGETRAINLPDGSHITMNSNTRVEINFSGSTRAVSLIRGEAEFIVAHEPERPFVVRAADQLVKAVGTAFNIELGQSRIEVLVTDGIVEVTKVVKHKSETPPVSQVLAGEVLAIEGNHIPLLSQLAPEDIAMNLSWQRGELVFTGEPLAEVVAEVSRYTEVSIVIVDVAVREIPIGGRFPTGDVDNLLNILQEGFEIRVQRIDDKLVHLSRAKVNP